MQTNFTEQQLKLKDNKSSEKILKKCVHCGMCNATCPTFNLLGDELDGPRGRIYLIQDMLENEKKPTANVVSKRLSSKPPPIISLPSSESSKALRNGDAEVPSNK